MTIHKTTKRIRHDDYLAEVDVELREYPGKEWSPTLSLEDVRKLERVRKALERGDLKAACTEARVYRIEPIEERAPSSR